MSNVREIDRGWRKISRQFTKTKGKRRVVGVGVQGEKAGESYPGGATNILVMSVQEYGAPSKNIPERAPLRSTFDMNLKKYKKEMADVGRRMASGEETAEQGLRLVGEMYRGDVVGRIQRGELRPPLKAETVAAKGGETAPLLRTGQLINSLSVEIKES